MGEQRTTQVLLKEAMASLKSVYAKEVGLENQVFHLLPVQPSPFGGRFPPGIDIESRRRPWGGA